MTNATLIKCECNSCQCDVSQETAVLKDGKYYCSEACASGHQHGQACGHSGCTCNVA